MTTDQTSPAYVALGQGCYLRNTIDKPGLRRVRLPVWQVLELMDCGSWQQLAIRQRERGLDALLDCYWRVTDDALEMAIQRLLRHSNDRFRKRLARQLVRQLPPERVAIPSAPDSIR